MRRFFQLLLLSLLIPLAAHADGWDENLYKQIEQSIKTPRLSDKVYLVTKFGAKTDGTAADNQKAIQKAIDRCSRKGGAVW